MSGVRRVELAIVGHAHGWKSSIKLNLEHRIPGLIRASGELHQRYIRLLTLFIFCVNLQAGDSSYLVIGGDQRKEL
jgi:hypothetical protein